MPAITKAYLTINEFSRKGNVRPETLGIVLHNVGVPNQTAEQCRTYFEGLKRQDSADNVPDRSASAQFVIGLQGEILQLMPVGEKAYHVGSGVYTPLATRLFGKYASSPATTSPNSCTIGIELCHREQGVFNMETIQSALWLTRTLMAQFKVDLNHVETHHNIVGWKACPQLWTEKPQLFEAFKRDLERYSLPYPSEVIV